MADNSQSPEEAEEPRVGLYVGPYVLAQALPFPEINWPPSRMPPRASHRLAMDFRPSEPVLLSVKIFTSLAFVKYIECITRLGSYNRVHPIHRVIHKVKYSYIFYKQNVDTLAELFRPKAAPNHCHQPLAEVHSRVLFQQIVLTTNKCHENNLLIRRLRLSAFIFKSPATSEILLANPEELQILPVGSDDNINFPTSDPADYDIPHYFAPEMLHALSHGESFSGKQADIFILGLWLYIFLHGCLPFQTKPDKIIADFYRVVRGGVYRISRHLSPESRDLLTRLLAYKPEDRPSLVDILVHPWFAPKLDLTPRPCPSTRGQSCFVDVIL